MVSIRGLSNSEACLSDPDRNSGTGIFPGQGRVIWRDWYTHEVVNASISANTTLAAPLGHINVHVRDGSAILLHAQPAYTIAETRQGPYSLLVAQAADGYAFGTAYIDDGETVPPTPNTTLTIHARKGAVSIHPAGNFVVAQTLDSLTVLGAARTPPTEVTVNGIKTSAWQFDAGVERLVLTGLKLDLNRAVSVEWR